MTSSIYDLLGVGFGPANLALDIAITETAEENPSLSLSRVFLDSKPNQVWHPDLLLPSSLLQINVLKDLVTDVSWNYQVKKGIRGFAPRPADAEDGTWRIDPVDVERVQEFRKCIECYLCQDVCHVLRDHHLHDAFIGPRFLLYSAALEMHPLDTADRVAELKKEQGVGYCNITKCCTQVCPEGIAITDNAIIPLKERVADRFYDPVKAFWRMLRRSS